MKRSLISIVLCLALVNSSCSNIFAPMADQNTDEARLEAAMKALNSTDYDTAITKFGELSPDYQAKEEVRINWAGAYAGKCGFSFTSFFTTITTGSMGSDTLFLYFMKMWTSSSTSRSYCRLAEDKMKLITPTYSGRDASQSLFMVLLAMAKIGIFLRELADANRDGAFDDPPYDATAPTGGFCLSANISDADVAEIGAALGIILTNLTNIGTVLSGNPVDTTTISAFCGTLTPNPCEIENESTILADAPTLKAFRTILNTPALGWASGLPCP